MTAPSTGAWIGRSPDHYTTKGAEVRRVPGDGWYARAGRKVRGPLSCLDSAMKAADEMAESAA
jgi:hypothetical protein